MKCSSVDVCIYTTCPFKIFCHVVVGDVQRRELVNI